MFLLCLQQQWSCFFCENASWMFLKVSCPSLVFECHWSFISHFGRFVSMLPKFCEWVEGELSAYEKWISGTGSSAEGFVLILSSTGSYSRTRKRCSSVYLLIVWEHTHTGCSWLGVDLVTSWLLHSYGKWTATNTICSDADGSQNFDILSNCLSNL